MNSLYVDDNHNPDTKGSCYIHFSNISLDFSNYSHLSCIDYTHSVYLKYYYHNIYHTKILCIVCFYFYLDSRYKYYKILEIYHPHNIFQGLYHSDVL